MRTEILFEDEDILVIYKPAGIAVESAGVGQMDVVSELKNHIRKTAGGMGTPYLGVVHRLDQPVEGLLLFAKNKVAAEYYTALLGKGLLKKSYLAMVYGRPDLEEGRLTDFLIKEKGSARVGHEKEPGAKNAILHYRLLEARGEMSLLQVWIETGRFHQIRVQLSHAGMPILGDNRYQSVESEVFSKEKGIRTVALCANTLQFVNQKKKPQDFEVVPKNPAFLKAGM